MFPTLRTEVLLIICFGSSLPSLHGLRRSASEELQVSASVTDIDRYAVGFNHSGESGALERHDRRRSRGPGQRHTKAKNTKKSSKHRKRTRRATKVADVEVDDTQFNYKRIQFVSYDICTMPHGASTWDTDDDWYVGNSDIPEDIAARMRLMKHAVDVAYERAEVEKSSDTLKVFMAPEFYFRGPNGAYTLKQVLGTKGSPGSFESRLASIVLDEKFHDWIFVFGTILGYRSKKNPDGKFEVYNIALVQQGGQRTLERAVTKNKAIVKQWKSRIDFLRDPQMGGLPDGMVEHAPWASPAVPTQTLNVSGDPDTLDTDNDGIFEMRGIKFGLEICLDHAMRRLAMASWKENQQNDVQVQLVTSGGMEIMPGSIAVQDEGLVFLTDGLMGMRGNSQCQVVRWAKRGHTTHASPRGMPQKAVESVPLWGNEWRAELSNIFNTRDVIREGPHVRVYPVFPLPQRKSSSITA